MDLGIAGRKAIVCASSRGLGRGCALQLARAGCEVVVNGRDAERTRLAAGEIARETGAKVTPVAGDVSTGAVMDALLAACPEPDILVNNNGGPKFRDFRELDRAAILEGVTQNMATPIELIRRTVDGMAARGFGRIVNITSMSVYMAIPGLDLSSGARAGLTAFLAGVARQVAPRGVTINNLLPGKFDTDRLREGMRFSAARQKTDEAEIRRREIAPIPAGRLGTAGEFGAVCAFLCSVHAGYITGRNIPLDGGLNPSAF
jgi:3-oxoacyl-[acyl-carrier protein] reductase